MFYAGVIVSASVNMLEYAEVRLMDISALEGQVEALAEETLKWTSYTCSPLADFEEQEWLLAFSVCICLSPQPSVIPIWQHDVILYSLCGASHYVTDKTWRTGCGILIKNKNNLFYWSIFSEKNAAVYLTPLSLFIEQTVAFFFNVLIFCLSFTDV